MTQQPPAAKPAPTPSEASECPPPVTPTPTVPRITRASGMGPAEGWANLTYEFEVVGETRNVHQLLRTLAEGPMAFEFEDITYRRRSADPLQKGINARVSVRLVTRQGLTKGPAAPVAPPAGGKA